MNLTVSNSGSGQKLFYDLTPFAEINVKTDIEGSSPADLVTSPTSYLFEGVVDTEVAPWRRTA